MRIQELFENRELQDLHMMTDCEFEQEYGMTKSEYRIRQNTPAVKSLQPKQKKFMQPKKCSGCGNDLEHCSC